MFAVLNIHNKKCMQMRVRFKKLFQSQQTYRELELEVFGLEEFEGLTVRLGVFTGFAGCLD
jgi:hypothetical protein